MSCPWKSQARRGSDACRKIGSCGVLVVQFIVVVEEEGQGEGEVRQRVETEYTNTI